jgi:hypothetical protein
VLLAGANNSGKTALLSALDLVVRGAVPTRPRHAAALEPARVRARFILSEEEQYQLLSSSDLSAEDQPEEAFRWVEWHFVEAPENALQALELHVSWREQRTVLAAQVAFVPPSSHRLVINRALRHEAWIATSQPCGSVSLPHYGGVQQPQSVKEVAKAIWINEAAGPRKRTEESRLGLALWREFGSGPQRGFGGFFLGGGFFELSCRAAGTSAQGHGVAADARPKPRGSPDARRARPVGRSADGQDGADRR